MKTRISQLGAIILFTFIFLVGNVNAKGTEIDASSHENIEATLELENWMTNKDIWDSENQITLEAETEQELAIEPWMTNENNWNI